MLYFCIKGQKKTLNVKETISPLRIITGSLKGRSIPSQTLGDVRLTPSRLKESIFNMLGTNLAGLHFLDLCAGSGQIGLEALSRGATVAFNEPEKKRYKILNDLLQKWDMQPEIFNQLGQNLIRAFEKRRNVFDIIYLDPPYNAESNGNPLITDLMILLSQTNLLSNTTGCLIAQHAASISLPTQLGSFICRDMRDYGSTSVNIYVPS